MAMGTKMAPKSANCFMSVLEEKFLQSQSVKPLKYLQFIDDIFLIWTEGTEKLAEFVDKFNTIHLTIKFTVSYSATEVNFLDTTVLIIDNQIETELYCKPTHAHLYLLPTF